MYTIDYIAIHSVDNDDEYITDHQKVGDVFLYSVAETIRRYIRLMSLCRINSALTVDTTSSMISNHWTAWHCYSNRSAPFQPFVAGTGGVEGFSAFEVVVLWRFGVPTTGRLAVLLKSKPNFG
jgi:hypothetical protein